LNGVIGRTMKTVSRPSTFLHQRNDNMTTVSGRWSIIPVVRIRESEDTRHYKFFKEIIVYMLSAV
jgi:hypothetical protein